MPAAPVESSAPIVAGLSDRALEALPVRHIRPSHGWVPVHLAELWEFRELLYFLVWRQVRVRYKQTLLGVAWAILQPVLTMVAFTLLFGKLAGITSDGLPYPVFTYAALLPWQLFAFALSESSNSVVANHQLLTKVYFPRLLLPLASVGVGLVDFFISFVVLLALMAWYGLAPGLAVLTVPFWALLAVITAVAVSLWLSALNVRYRDVRYTLPLLTQLWLLATPVAYPSSLVPDGWRTVYGLNPMVSVVDGLRWALLGGPWPGATLVTSGVAVTLILIGGAYFFRRIERTFADIV